MKDAYPNLAAFSSLYNKDIDPKQKLDDNPYLTFDEMRLIEELLIQADSKLKSAINSNSALFIETVHRQSTVKGIRWDDIVNRFEHAALEKPALEKQLEASSLKSEHKSKVSSHM